eukprot:GEZU01016332.1.p1 GENE.GEZU01016332.1~~GEZU01016332.1.p1  ORF type:complete len:498 (-),score=83.43 GEZU01016332.1:426-1919(-)
MMNFITANNNNNNYNNNNSSSDGSNSSNSYKDSSYFDNGNDIEMEDGDDGKYFKGAHNSHTRFIFEWGENGFGAHTGVSGTDDKTGAVSGSSSTSPFEGALAAERNGPQFLDLHKRGQFLKIERDLLTISYTGPGSQIFDVGTIQSDRPFTPKNGKMLAYYEVTVKGCGLKKGIVIGLAPGDYLLTRQPGFEDKSYGYSAANGKKYGGSNDGKAYATPYGIGDVVGCGINFSTNEIFFTKNGKSLGVAFKGVTHQLYPTIGLHSIGDRVTVNFGAKPFKFDFDSMVEEERCRIHSAVQKVPMEPSVVNALIYSYLLHSGYEGTLKVFQESAAIKHSMPNTCISQRKSIIKDINNGQILKAIDDCNTHFPQLLCSNKDVMLRLQCQHLIELIRCGDCVDEAVDFVQNTLSEYDNDTTISPESRNLLMECIGLLAYSNPRDSPLSHLLDVTRRTFVAEELNRAIMDIESQPRYSPLERVLQQLVVARNALTEQNGLTEH